MSSGSHAYPVYSWGGGLDLFYPLDVSVGEAWEKCHISSQDRGENSCNNTPVLTGKDGFLPASPSLPPLNLPPSSSSPSISPKLTLSASPPGNIPGFYLPPPAELPFFSSGYSPPHPANPRLSSLPLTYTDLYSTLTGFLPSSSQIALCLSCGSVISASGQGLCTDHAQTCGSGTCIFFLLQDCKTLIMHGRHAAYLRSFFVDRHGETPVVRGRPLTVDVKRLEWLREMWISGEVKGRVLEERGNSRSVIIRGYY